MEYQIDIINNNVEDRQLHRCGLCYTLIELPVGPVLAASDEALTVYVCHDCAEQHTPGILERLIEETARFYAGMGTDGDDQDHYRAEVERAREWQRQHRPAAASKLDNSRLHRVPLGELAVIVERLARLIVDCTDGAEISDGELTGKLHRGTKVVAGEIISRLIDPGPDGPSLYDPFPSGWISDAERECLIELVEQNLPDGREAGLVRDARMTTVRRTQDEDPDLPF